MNTAVITGANRGIGLGLVQRYLTAGWHVVACCREPERATELRALASSPQLELHSLDVTDEASIAALASHLSSQTVDVLINNAGINPPKPSSVTNLDYDAWRLALEVNTIAPFRISVALQPMLKRSSRPRVITVSSQMGSFTKNSPGSVAYRTSKTAANKAMQLLALEFGPDKIVVCPVHPGWVRTDMGGASGEISVEESADGLYALIDRLTMVETGRFFTWDGREHPW